MKQAGTSRADQETDYATRAVAALSSAWMRRTPNRSGMRAEFRRWRPTATGEPTLEMSRFIWGWMGAPGDPSGTAAMVDQTEDDVARTAHDEETLAHMVNRAAIVVALRAVAGDHPPAFKSMGAALYRSGISDLRLMRFLTAPRTDRIATLYRVCKLLDAKRLGIYWNNAEVKRMLLFIYGTEEQSRRSANHWASDFFASRGRTESDQAATTEDAALTDNAVESTEPSTTEG